ncbi:hypothetical protein EV363DRAFT_1163985, partial [Boletus edulis]
EPAYWSLLRNSDIDPVTGSTRVRLLHASPLHSNDLQFSCADLTLPAHSTENTLTISIDTHVVFSKSLGSDPEAVRIRKFCVDATAERCAGTVSDPSPLWPLAPDVGLTYSMVRGGECATLRMRERMGRSLRWFWTLNKVDDLKRSLETRWQMDSGIRSGERRAHGKATSYKQGVGGHTVA